VDREGGNLARQKLVWFRPSVFGKIAVNVRTVLHCDRYDKERQQFAVEIETVTTMLEAANKGKVSISADITDMQQNVNKRCLMH